MSKKFNNEWSHKQEFMLRTIVNKCQTYMLRKVTNECSEQLIINWY